MQEIVYDTKVNSHYIGRNHNYDSINQVNWFHTLSLQDIVNYQIPVRIEITKNFKHYISGFMEIAQFAPVGNVRINGKTTFWQNIKAYKGSVKHYDNPPEGWFSYSGERYISIWEESDDIENIISLCNIVEIKDLR